MEELSIEEMTSLRGGAKNVAIDNYNLAVAVDATLDIRSANRSGGIGFVDQEALAEAGNQFVSQS